ncbi:hypothetical protein N136_03454, partial [Leifsonia aquatica ATCC 14665]
MRCGSACGPLLPVGTRLLLLLLLLLVGAGSVLFRVVGRVRCRQQREGRRLVLDEAGHRPEL